MQDLKIIGRIGRDAEIKDFNNNQVISFPVAVSESYTNKTSGEKITNTTWFDCSKWGNNTSIAQYIKKGDLIFISGKVNNRAYQKDDGSIQVVNGINVNEIMLLGSKNESQSQQPAQQSAGDQFLDPKFNEEEHDDLPF